LAADLGVGIPLGNGAALAGDQGPRFLARVTVGADMGILHPSLDAGVLFRPSIPLEPPEHQFLPGATSEIHLGAAVTTVGKGLRWELSVRTILDPNVSKLALEAMAGARVPLSSGLEVSLLGGPGLVKATGTPLFRVLAGITYRVEPRPPIAFIDEERERKYRLTLAEPQSGPEGPGVQPTQVGEITRVTANPQGMQGGSSEPLRPYQPTPGEQAVLRGHVLFGRGSRDLQGVTPLLDQAVLRLHDQPSTFAVIEGHSDESEGPARSNFTLSLQRAQAVQHYLVTQGIDPSRVVRLRGLSSDCPVSAYASTEEERRLNRRVEVLLLVQAPVAASPGP
ncbi:MAG TPA: OmpA family protein, partial [Myxococcaceae bacterium]